MTPPSGADACGRAVSAAAAGRRRRLADDVAGLALVHLARAAQVVADDDELVGAAPLELAAARDLDLAVHARPDLARRRGRDHEHTAAVVGVGDAVGVAAALQPVQHRGDGARREAALVGQLAGRDPAAAVEHAEAAQVGAVEAELRGHDLVEPVGGLAKLFELQADLV